MRFRTTYHFWIVIAALLVSSLALPPASRADTYRIVDLGSDAARFLYGIDDAGTVVIDDSSYCANSCYFTYVNGNFSSSSPQPPDLVFDNGSPCAASPVGYVVKRAVCNGSRTVWTGFPIGDSPNTAVFDGPDPLLNRVAYGGEGPIMLNAAGDFVFDDYFTEQFYEAINTTVTPEPASGVLLLTGLAGIVSAEAARRRRVIG